MLSYENNPSDPLKSIGKSPVQHNCCSDENIAGNNINNSLPEAEHQLISSSVVDVPSFSIRDFVFSARNKDIETNWPFPEKHLKLCLKHGVKELLPPFESKTLRSKQLPTISLEKKSSVDDTISTRIRDEEPFERVDNLTIFSLNEVGLTQKITVNHLDASFDKPKKDRDIPSSDTSNSQAYPSRAGGTFKHHRFSKTSAKTPSSKCKLIVKFSSPSIHSMNEENMPYKTNLSDSPASKVCPVCKTFSSSSNTTLNAHIDQCLSMETASECKSDSRISTKCKVKPRKMRSMVDIYATALVCTIEDLDKRNGTNWATDLSLPAHNNGVNSAQGNKKQLTSLTEPDKEENDDGGVYIDANGRKLRILSKMDSFSSVVTTKEDNGSRKPPTNKTHSTNKKRHNKYLKLAVSNEKLSATKANSSQVLKAHKLSNDLILSKRSRDIDEVDKIRRQSKNQHPRHKILSAQRSTVEIQKSRLVSFSVEKSSFQDFDRDSACLSGSKKRHKSPEGIDISTKHSLGVKRTRPDIPKDDKNYRMNSNVHKRLKKSSDRSLNQFNRLDAGKDENRLSTAKSACSAKHINRFMQKSAEFCKDNTSSISGRLAHDPKIWKRTLCATNEEDQVQFDVEEDENADSDEDVATWQSESHEMDDSEHAQNMKLTIEGRKNDLEKDKRGVSRRSKHGAVSVNTCDENVDSLSVPLSSTQVVEHGRSKIHTGPMNLTAERTMRSFIRSMNPDDHERADSYEYQTSPQASNDSSTGPNSPSSADPVLDEGMCNYNMELDSKATQGNPSSDIDPIPIPGPPGSFLPSPGNAAVEDYQGNSSLTASLSSSHNEQSGGNLCKSPMSSASSLAAKASDKVAEKFPSARTNAIPDSPRLGFPSPSSEVSIVKAPLFPKFGSTRSEYGDQKSYINLHDENQPCCCSRKERVQRGGVIDYQESQLLRRRTMSASMLPTKEDICCSLNTAPSYSSAGSDIYSLSSSSFPAINIPALMTPAGAASPKYQDTIKVNKFHANGNSESSSPSAVLRLMGKNLMVAKNDEELSGPSKDDPASPCIPPKFKSYSSQFQKAVPPDPAMYSPSYSSNMKHGFDFRMPNGDPRERNNFARPGVTSHSQAASFDQKRPVHHFLPNNRFDTLPDHMHRGPSPSMDFSKAPSRAAAEHDQSRLIQPVYHPMVSSMPLYMQQVPGNTCFPVPFSTSGRSLNPSQVSYYYSKNGSYVLHGGGPFVGSPFSSSSYPRPGLVYSPKLP